MEGKSDTNCYLEETEGQGFVVTVAFDLFVSSGEDLDMCIYVTQR